MPLARVIRQRANGVRVVVRRGPLHRPDPDVAGGDAGQYRALEHCFAIHGLTGRDYGQAPGRWYAERVHRLADDVFPQHRPERRAAVAPSREARLACPFELNVHAFAGRRDLFAEQIARPSPRAVKWPN